MGSGNVCQIVCMNELHIGGPVVSPRCQKQCYRCILICATLFSVLIGRLKSAAIDNRTTMKLSFNWIFETDRYQTIKTRMMYEPKSHIAKYSSLERNGIAITIEWTNKKYDPHSVYHWCGGHKIYRIHSICLFFDSVNSLFFILFWCFRYLLFFCSFSLDDRRYLFIEWKIFIFIYFAEKSPQSVFVWVLFRARKRRTNANANAHTHTCARAQLTSVSGRMCIDGDRVCLLASRSFSFSFEFHSSMCKLLLHWWSNGMKPWSRKSPIRICPL